MYFIFMFKLFEEKFCLDSKEFQAGLLIDHEWSNEQKSQNNHS